MYESYRFDYSIGPILYGSGCVSGLSDELADLGASNALVVCGSTVGSTSRVIDPVTDGCGDRLAGVFDQTTTDKRLSTVFEGVDRMHADGIDALVGLGGGSSLDIAKLMSIVEASDREYDAIREEFEETKTITVPQGEMVPLLFVPTTLAGSDLSAAAGITTRRGGLTRGIVSDARLWPSAAFYDPDLFATTPHDILCAASMNGFDKAVETPYSRFRTPITDGTAVRSLKLLSRGLPRLGEGHRDGETMHDVINGAILAAYGGLRPDGRTSSIIHAICHPVSRGYAIQQGAAHGIIAPHALSFLFDRVDGRRALLADGLGVDSDDPAVQAKGIIEAVTRVRDALGLPARLRSIEDLPKEDIPAIARDVYEDHTLYQGPAEFEPTVEELETLLERAW